MARLCAASRYYRVGLEHRGQETMDKISPENIKLFDEQLELARAELMTLLQDPHPSVVAYNTYIELCMHGGTSFDDIQPMLLRYVKEHPGAWRAHCSMMQWLLPRWGGATVKLALMRTRSQTFMTDSTATTSTRDA